MNKKVNLSQILVFGMLIIALTLAFYQPAKASHTPIAIVAFPSVSIAGVYPVTRVYSEPDVASRVVDEMSLGAHFNILGLNASGSFIEIAKEGQSLPSGWVIASEVLRTQLVGTSRSRTQVHLSPSSASPIVSMVFHGTELKVLGHNVDGAWLAIENQGLMKTSIVWVNTSDIRLPDVVAQTSSLTKFYLRPDTSSSIADVRSPAYQVILIGRDSTNNWYAVAEVRTGKFIGWAQSNDLTGGINKELLPVIPIR